MNSKMFALFFIFLLSGCGVKAKPVTPPETAIKSYIESYTGPSIEEEKNKKQEPLKK